MVETFVSINLEQECDICRLATTEPLGSCDLCFNPPILNVTQGFNPVEEPIHFRIRGHSFCFSKAHEVLKQNTLQLSPARRKCASMPSSPRLGYGRHDRTVSNPGSTCNISGSPIISHINFSGTYSLPNSPKMGLQAKSYNNRNSEHTGSRNSLHPEDALSHCNISQSLVSLSSYSCEKSKKRRSCNDEPRYKWSPLNGRKHLCGGEDGLGLTPEGSQVEDSNKSNNEENELARSSYSLIHLRNGGRVDWCEKGKEYQSMASCKTGASHSVSLAVLGRFGKPVVGGSIASRYRRFTGENSVGGKSVATSINECSLPDSLPPSVAGESPGKQQHKMAMEETTSCHNQHDPQSDTNQHTTLTPSTCDINFQGENIHNTANRTHVASRRRPVSMYSSRHSGGYTWDSKADQLLRSKVMSSRTWCDCSQDFLGRARKRAARTKSCVFESELSRRQELRSGLRLHNRRHSQSGSISSDSDRSPPGITVEKTLVPTECTVNQSIELHNDNKKADTSEHVAWSPDKVTGSPPCLAECEQNNKNDTSITTNTKDEADPAVSGTETTPGGLVLTDAMKYTRDKCK